MQKFKLLRKHGKLIKISSLSRLFQEIHRPLSQRLDEVYRQDVHMEGKWMLACEEKLQQLTGRRYAHIVTSGTAGLIIMHLALDIKAGDTILATNMSIPSSIMPARVLGAKLKFVDIDKFGQQNLNDLDLSDVKAIITTGLYGDTHDHDLLKTELPIINDSCQAFLAKYKGVEATKFGDLSSISFAQNKTAPIFGTYGAILTDREDLSERIRHMRRCGNLTRDSEIKHIGINAQPHADKCVQVYTSLEYVDTWHKRRQEIASQYDESFKTLGIETRQSPSYSTTNHHKYVLFVNDNRQFAKKLKEHGVDSNLHYTYNFSKIEAIQETNDLQYPMTDFFTKHALTIPSNPWLKKDEIKKVVESVKNCMTDQDTAICP